MDVVKVEGLKGPLKHLETAVWKAEDGTYRILLDNPRLEKFLVITVALEPAQPAN